MTTFSKLSVPTPIKESHDFSEFSCGEPDLDEWLKERALANEGRASRTYVVLEENRVVAYYCLSVGSIIHENAIGKLKRNMPNPIPAMLIGRLAVDRKFSGKGLGSGLLKDALMRTRQIAEVTGVAALFVHAISENAKDFYLKYGFSASPLNPMTLMVRIDEAKLLS